MAATYRVQANNIIYGNGKSLLALWNGAGSTDILKVNRIYFLNNQVGVAAGTGILVTLHLTMITAYTGSARVFPTKLKTASSNLNSNVVASTGATVTEASQVLRRVVWSGDEPSTSELTTDTLQLIPNLNIIWDSGYVDTNTEPLTLNASQGVHVKCNTNTTATHMGTIIMEFTT